MPWVTPVPLRGAQEHERGDRGTTLVRALQPQECGIGDAEAEIELSQGGGIFSRTNALFLSHELRKNLASGSRLSRPRQSPRVIGAKNDSVPGETVGHPEHLDAALHLAQLDESDSEPPPRGMEAGSELQAFLQKRYRLTRATAEDANYSRVTPDDWIDGAELNRAVARGIGLRRPIQ